MRLIAASLVALVVVLLASQLLLSRYLEGRIERRLESEGGTADVTLEALPAVRLLAHDGDRLAVRGQDLGIRIELTDLDSRFLDELDGFDEVDMRLEDLHANPFQVQRFALVRSDGADTYSLRMSAATSGQALATYGAARLPGILAPLIGGTATVLAPRGRIPIEVAAELTSDDGRARVVRARGTVAGLQVGPLVELIAAAVVSRL